VRILLLTQIVPYPPDSGPKIKTFNTLKYLARRHEVHLISFVRPGAETEHAQALRDCCASVTPVPLRRGLAGEVRHLATSLVTNRPFLIERDDRREMRRAISALLTRTSIDAVHADQLSMGQFAVDLRVPLRVLDEHNAVWTIVSRGAQREPIARRLIAQLEWRKLRAYEGRLCRQFDWVTVVSSEDQCALTQAGGSFNALEIPIGVDTQELAFLPRTAEARHVLSVATMFYPPNSDAVRWFATHAFPMVRAAVPGTRFSVVGSRPPAFIHKLASAESGVVVAGYVPDLGPVLRETAVLVVPLRAGSGMRVKILEAFARGIPVVSTSVGVEGIEARAGEHLVVADSPEDFASAVTRILRDSDLAARLTHAARALVEQRYDWRRALAPLDQLYPTGPQE
jgi:glycosyltransferase involved in cell wall biosynthesis